MYKQETVSHSTNRSCVDKARKRDNAGKKMLYEGETSPVTSSLIASVFLVVGLRSCSSLNERT